MRILFLATDNDRPTGGCKMIYHLVDILNENGFEAYALHQTRNFRYTWFKNETPVRYTYQILQERVRSSQWKHFLRTSWIRARNRLRHTGARTAAVTVTKKDLIVLPATRAIWIDEILPGVPKVTLSQGPYLLLSSYQGGYGPDSTLFHPDIVGRITMSKLNYDMQSFTFPKLEFHYIPCFIDSELFSCHGKKKNQIAYMPRKGANDARALLNMLRFRRNLQDFEIVPIDNASQEEVARILKESLIFLSFSHREGLGLPAAEAMACGCIVIGYTGNGGEEFFNPEYCYPIAEGDLLSYAKTVERFVNQYNTAPDTLQVMGRKASAAILDQYSPLHTKRYCVEAFSALLEVLRSA